MTPDEVLDALRQGDFELIRSVASTGFREHISGDEMSRVWNEMDGSIGAFQSVGLNLVLHDLALNCERGNAHLQVAYRDDELSGLVLLDGAPTGRFGQ